MAYWIRRTDVLQLLHGPADMASTKADFADPVKGPLAREFFIPIANGEPLTDAMRAMTPDPYNVGCTQYGKDRDIPDIFGDDLGPWQVSERVKSIIEALEPGLHDFIPINVLKHGSKKHVPYQYYLLHTSRVIDAVVFEESKFSGPLKGIENKIPYTALSPFLPKITLDRSKIIGAHFWRQGIKRVGGGGTPFGPIISPRTSWLLGLRTSGPRAGGS